MRRILSLLCAIAMTLSLAACKSQPSAGEPSAASFESSSSPSNPPTSECSSVQPDLGVDSSLPSVLPYNIDSKYLDYSSELPRIAYTTPAKENGLSGNPYYVIGTVSEVYDGDNYTDSSRSVDDCYYFIVETEYGPVYFNNIVDFLYRNPNAYSPDSTQSTIDELHNLIRDNTSYFMPQIGDYVKVYGFYSGFSHKFNCAFMFYGLNEAVHDFMSGSNSEPDASDSVEEESADESSADSAEETAGPTTGEYNALRKAHDYLSLLAFSRSGLIEQLEYEGYSHDEAVYAADNCGANWKKQAVKKAKEYLDLMAFSRSRLIEQLEYDGFTHKQAVYGAKKNGY